MFSSHHPLGLLRKKKKVCNLMYSSFSSFSQPARFQKGALTLFSLISLQFDPNVGLGCQVFVCWCSLGSAQNAHLKQLPIGVHWMGHNRLWGVGCHSYFFWFSRNHLYLYVWAKILSISIPIIRWYWDKHIALNSEQDSCSGTQLFY